MGRQCGLCGQEVGNEEEYIAARGWRRAVGCAAGKVDLHCTGTGGLTSPALLMQ